SPNATAPSRSRTSSCSRTARRDRRRSAPSPRASSSARWGWLQPHERHTSITLDEPEPRRGRRLNRAGLAQGSLVTTLRVTDPRSCAQEVEPVGFRKLGRADLQSRQARGSSVLSQLGRTREGCRRLLARATRHRACAPPPRVRSVDQYTGDAPAVTAFWRSRDPQLLESRRDTAARRRLAADSLEQ